MPYIPTIRPADAHGPLADLYAEIARVRGRVANFYTLQSLDPEVLRAHRDLYWATMHRDREGLTRLEREAVALAVSAANECRYCVHHHTEALRQAGGTDALIDALQAGAEPDLEDRRLQRLVYFARKLTLLPNSMSRRDADDLRAVGLSDLEVLQAVNVAAYYNYVNRIVEALGVDLDS